MILFLAASAFAQAARATEFVIPFDFVIQGRSFPAGKYTIGRFDNSKPDLLIIKGSEPRKMGIFFMQPVESMHYQANPLLIFRSYGNKRVLYQVWGGGERFGWQILDDTSKPFDRDASTVMVNGTRKARKTQIAGQPINLRLLPLDMDNSTLRR